MKTIKKIEFKGKILFDSRGPRTAKLKLEPQPGMLGDLTIMVDAGLFPDDFKPIANPVDGDGRPMEHDIVEGEFDITIKVKRGER